MTSIGAEHRMKVTWQSRSALTLFNNLSDIRSQWSYITPSMSSSWCNPKSISDSRSDQTGLDAEVGIKSSSYSTSILTKSVCYPASIFILKRMHGSLTCVRVVMGYMDVTLTTKKFIVLILVAVARSCTWLDGRLAWVGCEAMASWTAVLVRFFFFHPVTIQKSDRAVAMVTSRMTFAAWRSNSLFDLWVVGSGCGSIGNIWKDLEMKSSIGCRSSKPPTVRVSCITWFQLTLLIRSFCLFDLLLADSCLL